jgi:HEAT repeat protein
MNELLKRTSDGLGLSSDGRASEVTDEVIRNPSLLPQLVEGLDDPDDAIRGRTAHALERISRTRQDILKALMPRFIKLAAEDKVPMVRWHLAMIFGNMAPLKEAADMSTSTLLRLVSDDSVFVKSWAIVSLTLVGRRDKSKRSRIIHKMKAFKDHDSVAIRTKARKALDILQNEDVPIPLSWSKSKDGS